MKSLVIWRINFFDYFVTLKLQKQNPKEKEGGGRWKDLKKMKVKIKKGVNRMDLEIKEKNAQQSQTNLSDIKIDKLINLLENQLKIQSYVLASQGVDVLKLLDKDLVDLCVEALERSNRRSPNFRKK